MPSVACLWGFLLCKRREDFDVIIVKGIYILFLFTILKYALFSECIVKIVKLSDES